MRNETTDCDYFYKGQMGEPTSLEDSFGIVLENHETLSDVYGRRTRRVRQLSFEWSEELCKKNVLMMKQFGVVVRGRDVRRFGAESIAFEDEDDAPEE